MSRPYRYAPPRPGRPLVRRSELLRRLQRRWDHRVTVVVAGAGFGKSSLLSQAFDENALAPRGDDCWLGCGRGDDEASCFAAGLATALGADAARMIESADLDVPLVGSALADEMWRRSPRQVCLVLDDVHEVGVATPAAALLAELVDALPANAHLVLSGRHEPPVPLARLSAQGAVGRLDERELAFRDDEIAAFAALRALPVEQLTDLGGWPALAELRAAASGSGVDDFLTEEVLSGLDAPGRRAAATVAALGGADQALVDAVLGPGTDLAAVMAHLPLVSSDAAGWYAVHPIWSDRLAGDLDPDDRREARRLGGLALAERDLHRAAELLTDAGAEDDLRAVLRTACRAQDLTASTEGLRQLHAHLPERVRASPEGELVAGIAVAGSDLERATRLLSSAAERFAEGSDAVGDAAGGVSGDAAGDDGGNQGGDDIGLLCAVEHLALCAHWQEDIGLIGSLWAYADRLAALPQARGLLAIGEALTADTAGDASAVLAALDTIDPADLAPYWHTPVAWLRASALLALGFPDAARRNAAAAVASAGPALRGALTMLLVNALAHCGDLNAADEALHRMQGELARTGHDHTRALGCTMAASRAGLACDVAAAEHHLAQALQHAGPEPRPGLVASLRGAEAAIALGRGDEEAAARLFAAQVGGRKVTEGRQRYGHVRRLALLYVLLPETRGQFADDDLGPCYLPALALARALVALREQHDPALAAALSPETWAAAPRALPAAWIAELATAAAAGGQADAAARVTDMGSAAGSALRRLVGRAELPRPVRTWARTLLDALPPEPSAPLELQVLGPTSLLRDGRPVDHPHWRRERVRALLLVLMARGGGTREELAGALWPDLDTTGALRNLRVTLSYLLAVLEPDRADGAPSFFVRTDGATLRLDAQGWLDVDAWAFDDLLDEAAEAEQVGEPSAALDLYRRAVQLYRGPYLVDAGYEEWALPHRDRLTARFVAGALRAGELTLAAGDADEALRLAARALESEPWSEGAHRLTVAAHLARGDHAAARRARETCLQQLDDLGVPPTEDTEIVLRAIA